MVMKQICTKYLEKKKVWSCENIVKQTEGLGFVYPCHAF